MNRLVLAGIIGCCAIIAIFGVFTIGKAQKQNSVMTSEMLVSPSESVTTHTITIEQNKITSGQQTITVKKNAQLTLEVVAKDQEMSEFRITGYNQGGTIQSGSTSQYEFVADKTGSFPLLLTPEQENDKATQPELQIGTLVVQ